MGELEDAVSHEPTEVGLTDALHRVDDSEHRPEKDLGKPMKLVEQTNPIRKGGEQQSSIEVKPDE
jgi:hypothetical protein